MTRELGTGSFRERMSVSAECELALISERAHLIVHGDGSTDELPGRGFLYEKIPGSEAFASAYRELKSLFRRTGGNGVNGGNGGNVGNVGNSGDGKSGETGYGLPPKESRGFIKQAEKSLDAFFATWFCVSVCRELKEAGRPLRAEEFFGEVREPTDLRVAYVRNVYSDAIYDLFSKVIPGLSVVYPGNFAAVCEEVYDGKAGFCILPLETSSEGDLHGFRRLAEKYELYPVMTAPAVSENPDGSQNVMRFALFSKSPVKLGIGGMNGIGETGGNGGTGGIVGSGGTTERAEKADYLKIDLPSPDGGTVSAVMFSAELAGLRFVRSESVPLSWADGRYNCTLTFDITGADPTPFLLFLELEVPESGIAGMYVDIVR